MASAVTTENTTEFKTALGNEDLTLVLDSDKNELVIELANSSRFEVYKKVIGKVSEIREITGILK